MGEGTVITDPMKRLQALADRVYRLECKVASLEWYKEHKTDGAIAYTAAKEERAIFQHFEKVAKEDDGD